MKLKTAKTLLKQSIKTLNDCKDYFTTKPQKDFSRAGKLPFEQMIQSILCMGAGSLSNEMMDFFGFGEELATTSAFVQKRAKILPEAFESLFALFTKKFAESKTYRGFQLLAVDGSDFLTAANPDDSESYFPGKDNQKPYNLLHLNALYDVVRHVYVDALLQKCRSADEHDALVSMADRSQLKDVLLLADRGYESYNVFAHIQEKGWKFLFRVKNGAGGIVSGLDLPDEPTFDVSLTLNLTNKQTNEVKRLLKDKNHYKHISHADRFDFLPKQSRKHDPTVFFPVSFRIVRFPISKDTSETIITNLDADRFPPSELKNLYSMRWGIETSFRELKYSVGLQHFHAKKTEFVQQEIFARLTMYNFYELITQSVVIQHKNRKYAYKVNFSAAVHICREFFLRDLAPSRVEALLTKFISPVRPGRSSPRKLKNKHTFGFTYRVA